MQISFENAIRCIFVLPAISSVLTAPVFSATKHLSAIKNNALVPSSMDNVIHLENKISELLESHDFSFLNHQEYDGNKSRRGISPNKIKYQGQRECLKKVINDLYSLDEIIKPQIFESETCSHMAEINSAAENKLSIKLAEISPTSCLKFCEETNRQLNENLDNLGFREGHLNFELRTLENNLPIADDAEQVRNIIDGKLAVVQKTRDEIYQLQDECDSVLDKEAKNIASSTLKKNRFNNDCRPLFNSDIKYPTFPALADTAYDGVSMHRGNLIGTCREMLIEHIELANTEIWQKKSTDRSTVDF
ncbi:hypothetical protein [Rouxiella sp. WC2420]|uniref:Uncharacterized protein n=1 Tax=Rouxiella sp. WC2420 TaxID=3234145 RepID=A0AB39VMI1_9GAMM